jgi:hypothetical protein
MSSEGVAVIKPVSPVVVLRAQQGQEEGVDNTEG